MTTLYLDKDIELVLDACIENNHPLLLIGETGTGKTTAVREKAKTLGKDLIRVSLNGSTSIEEILGKWLASNGSTYWVDGVLVQAMKEGKWVVFDEINAALPEILFALHSLLDDDRKITLVEKNGEVIHPHSDFRFFGTMNPPEEYAGTKDVNRALMSRFTAVVYVEVPDNVTEVKILTDKGIDETVAITLVALADRLRKEKKDEKIYYFCSTRDLIHAGILVKAGVNLEIATHKAIGGKMSQLEFDVVKSLFADYSKESTTSLSELLKNEKALKDYKKALKEAKETIAQKEENIATMTSEIEKLRAEEDSAKIPSKEKITQLFTAVKKS